MPSKKTGKPRKRSGLKLVFVVFLAIVLVAVYILYSRGFFDEYLSSLREELSQTDDSRGDDSQNSSPDVITDELSVHFLMLGNQYSGDCTLIKVGDTEVLIDAGSTQSSASTLISYIDRYCEDGILEYVIATHADTDHISGFVGTKSGGTYGGILYRYRVGTLIQFDKTNKSLTTSAGNPTLYANYLTATEYAAEQGAEVYTALQCWNNENGAQRSYELSENVTMNILYNVFYEESSSDENNYSVCMLLSQGNNHYLFTGDLEKDGEEALVQNNVLPKCKLFKAGHHGSPTSSNDVLLSVIQPEIVCVSCCCGSTQYTSNMENVFPSQAFVDRVAPYTEKIYVTTVVSDNADGFEAMNGNIVVSSDGGEVKVNCSNNDLIFKETDWFKANRIWRDGSEAA